MVSFVVSLARHSLKSNYAPQRECLSCPLLSFLRPRCHWRANCRHHRPASAPPSQLMCCPLHRLLHLLLASRHFTLSAACPLLPSLTGPPPQMEPSGVRQIPDIPGSGPTTARGTLDAVYSWIISAASHEAHAVAYRPLSAFSSD